MSSVNLTQRGKLNKSLGHRCRSGERSTFEKSLSSNILFRNNSVSSKPCDQTLRASKFLGEIHPGANHGIQSVISEPAEADSLFRHLSEVLHVQVLFCHRLLSGAQLPWQCPQNRTSPTYINRRYKK